MNRAPRILAIAAIVAYVAVWVLISSIVIFKQQLDGLLMLAVLTTPSSAVVGSISHMVSNGDTRTIVALIGFLIVGSVQYGIIGYVVGLVARSLAGVRRDA